MPGRNGEHGTPTTDNLPQFPRTDLLRDSDEPKGHADSKSPSADKPEVVTSDLQDVNEAIRTLQGFFSAPAIDRLSTKVLSLVEARTLNGSATTIATLRRDEKKERIGGLTYRQALRRGQWLRFISSVVALLCFTVLAYREVVGKELVATFFVAFMGYIWIEVSNTRKN